ncbi:MULTISPECIES: DcaP family trimeric outer membrane transporter [unclassified Marinobacter]|uniref:DcaP family trimeric outer membrane transporter n=1 Tax=unclassified Marinobacter TaxID=83889 RepID=UPI0026E3C290|nr:MULTISPECIES: DcaP family trimeric outer membrane transporter [unclassified Marinobacter]MDO6443188.1 DcaP family trimeric outer membrane transporter [Marinobacter sp. 2_MG-2023]MDO6822592.1 DcaP family trimeric outer membrane transporter [Marinobacter sp. 1_MG-2023]
MQSNKLRMAIRATAAVAVLSVAGQANALSLNVGDDVEASLYGYARLNMSYDLDGDRAVSTRAGSFSPSANEDAEGHFGADVQQSRLGVKVKHSSGVAITVEGDFRGSGNGAGSLRMRHAYGEYNGFLAGRTWSNYLSFVGNTPTLDFDSLAGTAGSQDRTEQIRYTTGAMSFSLEDPSSQAIVDGSGRTSSPAFTARLEDSAGAVSYSGAVMASQVTSDDGSTDDSAIGYGVFGAIKLKLNDMFSVQGALNYTDGASGYLWRSGSNYYGASAYMDGNSIETIEGYGGSVGVSMKLGGGRSINLGYGMTTLDLDDAIAASSLTNGAAETNQNVLLNYMWTPVQNVMMGIEYGYLDQETVAGDSSDANRLMFAAQYSF